MTADIKVNRRLLSRARDRDVVGLIATYSKHRGIS